MSIEELLRTRSANEYADFVLPSLRPADRVLDVGCGAGSITLGLAQRVAHVTGVDVDGAEFAEAREYAAANDIGNVEFAEGSILGLDIPDASFDACTMLSMLETVEDPAAGLREIHRVLRPGGLVGASSIEYGGLILAGPDEPLLRRFYELRLQIWGAQGDVDIHAGGKLRGRFATAGFEQVDAWTTYFSYGTPERVRWFGLGRAADCRDEWYVDSITELGLADPDEIHELERAWLRWAESPDAFAAFAWGRATARRP